ncbi:hypothetical protein EV702DRAFT_1088638 [Suillus placidus]|uniref:Transmembrane protein n=1 Tax=Suillus placidus TaxID=48579 RepID=A0A9P7D5A1_9AGAM|nr:hypothetical protein EV702DRAFT_1088638 [Suillus placidus]
MSSGSSESESCELGGSAGLTRKAIPVEMFLRARGVGVGFRFSCLLSLGFFLFFLGFVLLSLNFTMSLCSRSRRQQRCVIIVSIIITHSLIRISISISGYCTLGLYICLSIFLVDLHVFPVL